jgi:NAD(P)-dependent dehydrogenase (short-subunit alcohol dehydrogenase family)
MAMSSPVALITGAVTGIGHATAISFARSGNRIIVSGRRKDAGQTFERELRSLRADAEFVQADVRHEEDIRRLLDRTVARFGRLDLVAVAGGSDPLRDKYPQ